MKIVIYMHFREILADEKVDPLGPFWTDIQFESVGMLNNFFDELVEAVHAFANEIGVEIVTEQVFTRKFEPKLVATFLYLTHSMLRLSLYLVGK